MENFFTGLGSLFLCLSVVYLLGLLPRFARRFYPSGPHVIIRGAAPVIFAVLAMACFKGFGYAAMIGVVAVGLFLIIFTPRPVGNSARL